MNEIEKMMREDIATKKNISRSAYSKKGGKGNTKCHLPSDNLTEAQWKRKNGGIETVKLNEIITWPEFKKLSINMQYLYLENFKDNYGATQTEIAEAMGIKQTTLSAHVVKYLPNLTFTAKRSGDERWVKLLDDITKPCSTAEVTPEEEKPTEEAEKPAVEETKTEEKLKAPELIVNSLHGNISFVGDPYSIFTRAVKLFDENKNYNITISFREEPEKEEITC